MKKIYNAPEADLLCFRAVEGLAAINFDNIYPIDPDTNQYGAADAAATSLATDIKITIGK